MEDALRLGAETVGGLDPCAIDRDPKGHLDAVFGLAERFGRGVDIHLHEPGEMGAFSMELIIERTRALGMHGNVMISHAFCLGMPDPAIVDPLIAALAEAGIAICTTAPPSRPVPAVKRLMAAGVTVCAGATAFVIRGAPTAMRTCWNARCLSACATICGATTNWRWRWRPAPLKVRALGLPDYGLEVGCHADFVLVAAETVPEAVAQRPHNRLVVRRGCLIAADREPDR